MKRKESELTVRWKHLLTFLILLHHKAQRPRLSQTQLALPRGCVLAVHYRSR
jgi:hypothetical protein